VSRAPQVWRGSEAVPSDRPVGAVTVGNFDGVHLGHRALLDAARVRADALGGPVVVCTFHPPPRDVMAPGNGVLHVQTLDDRIDELGRQGADVVVVEPFTRELAGQPPEWFATEVLSRRLGAGAVVIGWDFRFGRGRAGDGALLRRTLDVPVDEVVAVEVDGAPVSSTRVREAVAAGEVAAAARLLGRPHEVVGVVVPGDARGRRLGFPTANVAPDTALLPAPGVYAVRARVGDGWVDGVANLGRRPTFDGEGLRLEVHLLDGAPDLYGQRLHTGFVARLRGEVAFPDVDALRAQIAVDVAAARAALGAAR
jgi:riboflavin kinase/FMN adenylyltransferase